MEEVKIVISPDGRKVTVAASGFSGPGCEAATRAIVAALGSVESDTKTPEFYQDTVNEAQQNA